MEIQDQALFVGAKGKYKDLPFEVLGSGLVDYTISQVGSIGDPEDIGQTFTTREYYCLANNGQTWFFAVSDGEVYYCRQLDADEIQNLQTKAEIPKNIPESKKITIVESGRGNLKKAEGRAQRDLRDFKEFEYVDFRIEGKSYSVDTFPDGKQEWFETIWIPEKSLTEIFRDSLRLGDPEAEKMLKLSDLWKRLSSIAYWLSGLTILVPLILSFQTKNIYTQERQISGAKGSEVVFENIRIEKPNKIHQLKVSTELLKNKGISLNLSFFDQKNNLTSTSDQEFTHSQDLRTSQIISNYENFYPKTTENYNLVVRLNDYGELGKIKDTEAKDAQIKIKVEVLEGGVSWFFWIFSAVISLLTGIFSTFAKIITDNKAWKVKKTS